MTVYPHTRNTSAEDMLPITSGKKPSQNVGCVVSTTSFGCVFLAVSMMVVESDQLCCVGESHLCTKEMIILCSVHVVRHL